MHTHSSNSVLEQAWFDEYEIMGNLVINLEPVKQYILMQCCI